MRLIAPRARLPCPRTQELLSSEGPQSQAEPPATRFAERFPSSAQSQGEPLRHREAYTQSAKTSCLQDSVQPPLSPREEGWELAASMQDCLHPAEYPDSCRSSSSPSPAQPECCHAARRPCGTGVSALTPSPRSLLLFSGYSLLWSNVAAETNTPPWLPPSRAPPVSTHAIYSSHRALGLTCFPSHALAALPRGPVLATPGAGGPRRAAPLYHMW